MHFIEYRDSHGSPLLLSPTWLDPGRSTQHGLVVDVCLAVGAAHGTGGGEARFE